MISLLCILLLAGCQPKRLGNDFEGKIVYKMFDWETHGLDSAQKEMVEMGFLKDSMISYFDEGIFLSIAVGSPYEYQYLNPHTNEIWFKLKNNDSVRVLSGGKPFPGQAPLLDAWQELNTDTILGHVCHKLTLKFKDETRIYLYSPDLVTNPEWYQQTRAFDYDVIYKRMKAYYLSMQCIYPNNSFTLRATGIYPGKVPANIFPKVDKSLQVR